MFKLPVLNNNDQFFVYLLHLITSEFGSEAVLKGGMVLRLLGSTRKTLDIDYTFVPYSSKKDILKRVEELFSRINEIDYHIKVNSKAIRINLSFNELRAQIEINVAKELKSEVISTASILDETMSLAPRIIKIMSLDIALANKLAAWNERRLLRDLYDIYYFLSVQKVEPDWDVLDNRLSNFESRIPKLKKIKKMSRSDLADNLEKELNVITQLNIEDELKGLIDSIEVPGLVFKFKDSLSRFLILLRD